MANIQIVEVHSLFYFHSQSLLQQDQLAVIKASVQKAQDTYDVL